MKTKFWNADKIVAISAILISLATMAIYLYQTHLIQKQQSASVMPYLMIGYSSRSDDNFSVEVMNDGLGPAFIEEVNVYYKDKKYAETDISVFFYQHNPVKDTLRFGTSSLIKGMLLPAGKSKTNVETNERKSSDKMKKYFWGEESIKLEIIYSTIYGEKWVVKGGFQTPKKIE